MTQTQQPPWAVHKSASFGLYILEEPAQGPDILVCERVVNTRRARLIAAAPETAADRDKWAAEAMRLKDQNVDLQAVNTKLLEALQDILAPLQNLFGDKPGVAVVPNDFQSVIIPKACTAIKAATEG